MTETHLLDLKIKRLEGDLAGYLNSFTNDRAISADIAQEAFLKSLDFIKSEEDPSKIKAYTLTVARHLAIDYFRKFGKKADLFQNDNEASRLDKDEPIRTPEMLVIAKEDSETVLKLLQRLKPLEREILTLYYYNDLKLQEISSMLDIPIKTAITRLCRARRELKLKMLKDKSYEMP
jgi:RNA polymerase sigma factor (sigma-70 family)